MTRVTIHIDGEAREVEAGRDLLTTLLFEGTEVPHFCWHEALGSVGACRLCAVRVHTGPDDAEGRIEMACMTPVAEGQRIESLDPEAAAMRAHVIEWLMVNHPHDCAVCEEGGACHLQDMTVATGHRTRRYRFTKRTHRNQDIGPLLTHEMNRCIACYRCTRFYRHYAGGRDLDVFGAHDRVWFGRAEDGPLESPFAGNLAEICPTGVFNDKGWSKDYARKWDMAATPSVCTHCAVGCNLFAAARDGRLRRVQNRYHGAINGHFLCDRGRFGALHVVGPQLREARLAGVIADGADALAAARAALAGGAVALVGPRASLETGFALRSLVGTGNLHAATTDHEAHSVARMAALLGARPAPVELRDIETADAALVLGEDLTGTAPRAALALRQTARQASLALAAEKGVPGWLDNAARVAGEGRRAPIALVTPMPDALDDVATWPIRRAPGDIAAFGRAVAAALEGVPAEPEAEAVATALAAAEAPAVIAGYGCARADVIEAAGAIAAVLGDRARLALFPPEANSLGLALLTRCGLETAAMALEEGEARTLVIADADLHDCADAPLAERVLEAAETVIVLDTEETRSTARADILLPVASWAEAAGTIVSHAGRAQRLFAAVASERTAAWRTLAAMAPEAPDWPDLDALLAAMAQTVPGLAAVQEAAPPATTRTPLGQIARVPWRFSGRTAHDRAGRIPEGTPPPDPDSALAFSMEGAHGRDVPPALRTGYDAPGMHSASAAYRFVEAPHGPALGGDPGAFVVLAGPAEAAEDPTPEGDGLLTLPLHDPFAGEARARKAERLALRCPPPRLALHPEDAAALGLSAGDIVRAGDATAMLTLDPALPRGHLGLSSGRLLPRGPARRIVPERAT